MLKKLTILRDRVENWDSYPFCIPVIRSLGELIFRSRICFFAGENGTGKSTLLEAIAAHYGFGPEGGNRNFRNDSQSEGPIEVPDLSDYSICPQVAERPLQPVARVIF